MCGVEFPESRISEGLDTLLYTIPTGWANFTRTALFRSERWTKCQPELPLKHLCTQNCTLHCAAGLPPANRRRNMPKCQAVPIWCSKVEQPQPALPVHKSFNQHFRRRSGCPSRSSSGREPSVRSFGDDARESRGQHTHGKQCTKKFVLDFTRLRWLMEPSFKGGRP